MQLQLQAASGQHFSAVLGRADSSILLFLLCEGLECMQNQDVHDFGLGLWTSYNFLGMMFDCR